MTWVPVDDVFDEPGTWWVPGMYDCANRCGGEVELTAMTDRRVRRVPAE